MCRELLIEKYIKSSKIENRFDDIVVKSWFNKYRKLHSINSQPARISYNINGLILSLKWFKNGVEHREGDKFDVVDYNLNKKVDVLFWLKNGLEHRENGKPSYVSYLSNGSVVFKTYFGNGIEYKESDSKEYKEKYEEIYNNFQNIKDIT
jgi:hypothetical protein